MDIENHVDFFSVVLGANVVFSLGRYQTSCLIYLRDQLCVSPITSEKVHRAEIY